MQEAIVVKAISPMQATTYVHQLPIKDQKWDNAHLSDAREIHVCSQQCISYGQIVTFQWQRPTKVTQWPDKHCSGT